MELAFRLHVIWLKVIWPTQSIVPKLGLVDLLKLMNWTPNIWPTDFKATLSLPTVFQATAVWLTILAN